MEDILPAMLDTGSVTFTKGKAHGYYAHVVEEGAEVWGYGSTPAEAVEDAAAKFNGPARARRVVIRVDGKPLPARPTA